MTAMTNRAALSVWTVFSSVDRVEVWLKEERKPIKDTPSQKIMK